MLFHRKVVAPLITTAFLSACTGGAEDPEEEPLPLGFTQVCFSTDAEFDDPSLEYQDQTFILAEALDDEVDPPDSFLECTRNAQDTASYRDSSGRRVWLGVSLIAREESDLELEPGDILPAGVLSARTGAEVHVEIADDSRGPQPSGLVLTEDGLPTLAVASNQRPSEMDLGLIQIDVMPQDGSDTETECAQIGLAGLRVEAFGQSAVSAIGTTAHLTAEQGTYALTNIHTVHREANPGIECVDVTTWTTATWILAREQD